MHNGRRKGGLRMRKSFGFTLLVVGATVLSASSAHAFGMSFSWGPTKKCFDSKSPPITLAAVPKETVKVRFRMVDLDAPGYPHGGGTVAYSGKDQIAYGAFRYKGPCPPSPHTYTITAEALDAKGKVIAKASARKRFP